MIDSACPRQNLSNFPWNLVYARQNPLNSHRHKDTQATALVLSIKIQDLYKLLIISRVDKEIAKFDIVHLKDLYAEHATKQKNALFLLSKQPSFIFRKLIGIFFYEHSTSSFSF